MNRSMVAPPPSTPDVAVGRTSRWFPVIDLTRSHDIPAPAAAVWAVLADYRRDPAWRTGVVSMEPDTAGLARPGTTTHEVLRLAGQTHRVDAVVDAVEPGARLTWTTTSGADARGVRLVAPIGDDRCRATLGITITPHGAERLLAPMVRRIMGRNLERDLAALAALVAAAPRTEPALSASATERHARTSDREPPEVI